MHILGIGFFILCGDYLYIRKRFIKMGYIYHTDPKQATPYFGSSSGCVIFSKYPIINSCTNAFNNRRMGRYKGWTFAEILIINSNMNQTVKIINTHLDHNNVNMQYEQMKEIVKFVKCQQIKDKDDIEKNNDDLYLCMGDFNVCSNHSYGGNGYDLLCQQMKIIGLNTDLYKMSDLETSLRTDF